MRRYLKLWLVLTGCLILSVGAFNFLVDPYGLFRFVDSTGFNLIKPKSGGHGEIVKAYQVLRVQPQVLILGNSRAEVGFDPTHQAWPFHPVFNLALPGTGTHTSLLYLQHVLAATHRANQLKTVVWGLDFMDFLIDRTTPQRQSTAINQRLLGNHGDSTGRTLQEIKDDADALLTLGAVQDSMQTLASQHTPYSADLTPLGFNPMHDYLKITADEGYWAVFRQKDIANTRSYLSRPKEIFETDGHSSPALRDLREVIKLCHENHIDLHLIIYPYHAHLLEIIRLTGHQSAFDTWKRTLVVTSEAVSPGYKPVPLWDFSQINEITGEQIPPKGDRQSQMRWYWEAGHFKSELGDLVLNRVFNFTENTEDFGVLLNSRNVETQMSLNNRHDAAYQLSHPQELKILENMVNEIHSTHVNH